MLKGKFSSRRRVTEEVDAMSGLANLSDVMLVFACGLMAAVILNWNVDLSKTRVEILQREQMKELDNAEELGRLSRRAKPCRSRPCARNAMRWRFNSPAWKATASSCPKSASVQASTMNPS